MSYFNNKNAYMHQVRRANHIADIRTENCISATYDAYMLFALFTLCEKCGFREKRIKAFYNAFHETVRQYQNGEINQESIKERLLDEYGIEFEKFEVKL